MDKDNKTILRINNSLHCKDRVQEEQYIKEIERIIASERSVESNENLKDYELEDALRLIWLLKHITVEVLCEPVRLDKDFSKVGKDKSFKLNDDIRLTKINYSNVGVFYPVFADDNDEALGLAVKLNMNVTLKMSGAEFFGKMKKLAPVFLDRKVEGIVINPDVDGKTFFLPGNFLMYALNVKDEDKAE